MFKVFEMKTQIHIMKYARKEVLMFKNLNAEMARHDLTTEDMAGILGYKSRKTFETKKKNGDFTLNEVKFLARFFNVTVDYLFETAADNDMDRK